MSWAQRTDEADARRCGGKAAVLARAIGVGLHVPRGLALAELFG